MGNTSSEDESSIPTPPAKRMCDNRALPDYEAANAADIESGINNAYREVELERACIRSADQSIISFPEPSSLGTVGSAEADIQIGIANACRKVELERACTGSAEPSVISFHEPSSPGIAGSAEAVRTDMQRSSRLSHLHSISFSAACVDMDTEKNEFHAPSVFMETPRSSHPEEFSSACLHELRTSEREAAATQTMGIAAAYAEHLLKNQETELEQRQRTIILLTGQLRAAEKASEINYIKAAMGGFLDCADGNGHCSNESDPALLDLREKICHAVGGLVMQQQRGGETEKKRREFSKVERAFYGLVLAYAGVLALTFIAHVLGGPAVSVVKKWRSKDVPKMMMGVTKDAINHNMRDVVIPTLKSYNLMEALFLVGEDGSALKLRLDLVVESRDVWLYGANNGPHLVKSLEDLISIILVHGLCTTMYVVSLIPQVGGAPSLPIIIDANNNTMTRGDMHRNTMNILQAAAKNGLRGKIFGGAGDGAPFVRNQTKVLQAHAGDLAEKYVTVEHPLICLRIPYIEGYGYFLQTQDWMHIAWRNRICFLNPKKDLTFVPGLRATPSLLMKASQTNFNLGLHAQDLNYKDKQRWDAVRRLSGLDSDSVKNSDIITELEKTPEMLGVAMYLTFMSYYVQIFTGEKETIDSIIQKCAWILAFLAVWKFMMTRSPELTFKQNFLTHETFTDVVISVTNLVLLIVLFRDCFGEEAQQYWDMFRLLPSYLSSRFLEYLFSFCRSEHR
uniref:Uncharacterized protein n=1 Tax=Octactis speculum TaxID=3111310 RepID=A0A7S2CR34_9STRA|mmetsp:Transcript_38909/g.52751  ORF Transcript_38909/g.52751 Transcript_38909/m.52751 type:complete len:737 (+) Transcript_38909:54-2264(+)